MKWIIGGRQYGKTTKLIEKVCDHPGDAVVVVPTDQMARFTYERTIEILRKSGVTYLANSGTMSIQINTGTKYFRRWEEISSKGSRFRGMAKFIDNADILLESLVGGRLLMATGNGPAYQWPKRDKEDQERFQKMMSEASKGMSPERFEAEMLGKWS